MAGKNFMGSNGKKGFSKVVYKLKNIGILKNNIEPAIKKENVPGIEISISEYTRVGRLFVCFSLW
jgi:hypothetical protein